VSGKFVGVVEPADEGVAVEVVEKDDIEELSKSLIICWWCKTRLVSVLSTAGMTWGITKIHQVQIYLSGFRVTDNT